MSDKVSCFVCGDNYTEGDGYRNNTCSKQCARAAHTSKALFELEQVLASIVEFIYK